MPEVAETPPPSIKSAPIEPKPLPLETKEKEEADKTDDKSDISEKLFPKEVVFGIAALKQQIEHDREGEGFEEMEVLEERGREFARARMTEDRERWQGRFSGIRRAVPRMWKYTLGNIATYKKEKAHGMRLQAEAGIQTQALPYEFVNDLDAVAQANIDGRRGSRRQRIFGRLRDIGNELKFSEKELHRERVDVIRQLRTSLANPDPNNEFQRNNQALIERYRDVLSGDFQAAEQVARRINSPVGDEVIHTVIGERQSDEVIEVINNSPVGNFLKTEVIAPLIREGLTNGGNISEQTLFNARTQMREFFFRPEFIQWYDQQAQNVREAMRLSLSYGSDMIPVIQEVFLPQLLQAQEHAKSVVNVDDYIKNVVLKVNVGTLEAGPKGIINEGAVERLGARAITNERVMGLYQQIRDTGNTPALIPTEELTAASRRAQLLGSLVNVGTRDILWGAAVGGGIYLASSAARKGAGLLLPFVGSATVSAAIRGAEANRMFRREGEQHDVESELGYEFAEDVKRRRAFIETELHKRQMEDELTTPMREISERISSSEVTPAEVTRLLGLIADTEARIGFGDQLGLADELGRGLLRSRNPQSYQLEKTKLEFTKAQAKALLRQHMVANPSILTQIQTDLGLAGSDVDQILTELRGAVRNNISTGENPQYQVALGTMTLQEAESIDSREAARNWARRRRVGQEMVASAFLGASTFFATKWALDEAQEYLFGGDSKIGSNIQNELKDAFKTNKRVELGNGIFIETNNNNGVNGMAGLVDSNGNSIPFPRPLFVTDQGTIVIAGDQQDISQIPQNIRDVIQNKAGGWTEQGPIPNADYNVLERFKTLANGNQRTEFRYGRMNFAIDPPGSASNPTPLTIVDAQVLDGTDPTGKTFLGDKVTFGFDRQANALVFDPENPVNSGKDFTFIKDELEKDGYKFANIPDVGVREVLDKKAVLGPNGEWMKHTSSVGRQWYDYDTSWSEKHELDFRTLKQGDSVILDANRMTGMSMSSKLSPQMLSVHEAIQRGEIGYAFSMPGQEDHPIIVMDWADGLPKDGQLRLNPFDVDPTHVVKTPSGDIQLGTFSQMVLDYDKYKNLADGDIATEFHNRMDTWRLNGGEPGKMGTISAGRLVERDGRQVWQSFATIRGSGSSLDFIETKRPALYDWIGAKPPEAIEFIPPPAAEDGFDGVPIGIPAYWPRRPLEEPEKGKKETPEPWKPIKDEEEIEKDKDKKKGMDTEKSKLTEEEEKELLKAAGLLEKEKARTDSDESEKTKETEEPKEEEEKIAELKTALEGGLSSLGYDEETTARLKEVLPSFIEKVGNPLLLQGFSPEQIVHVFNSSVTFAKDKKTPDDFVYAISKDERPLYGLIKPAVDELYTSTELQDAYATYVTHALYGDDTLVNKFETGTAEEKKTLIVALLMTIDAAFISMNKKS